MTTGDLTSIYDCECTDLHGRPLSMKQFEGKPILLVNTASFCGFSTQFRGLEETWLAHKDKGLIVIGVPSNDFGKQEPGNSAKIASLCLTKFGVTFPMLAKTPVKGNDAHPLFRWLAKEGGFLGRPRWNFYKYIISKDGRLQDWFSPLTPPEADKFKLSVAKAVASN